MSRNNLIQIHGDLPVLSCLRTLNVSHNKIRASGIPNDIFALDDINVVVSYFVFLLFLFQFLIKCEHVSNSLAFTNNSQ